MTEDKRKHSGLGCLTLLVAFILYFVIEEISFPIFHQYRKGTFNLTALNIGLLLLWVIGQAGLVGFLGILTFKKSSKTGKVLAGIGMAISLFLLVIIVGWLIFYSIKP